ncbi:MAG: type 4a pilus biogenesis protein PilO [Opitutae bacterium]|nr:type 4a pilus biogenesis protein PilO [Opitutae bacterium]
MNAFLQILIGFFRRHPFSITCSLLAVLLWIGNYFIWTRHSELTGSHQTLQRSGEDMLQALTNHGRITAELNSVKQALAFVEQSLIQEGDLPANLGYFYQLESSSRLRLGALTQLSSQPPPADQPYKTVPFTLRATGTYRQVLRFLRELETGPRLFKIQTYAFTQAGNAAGESAGPQPPGRAASEVTTGPALITLDLTIEVLAHP